jgi:hypothetical protein
VQLKLEATHPAMAQTIQKVVADAATRILDESGALSRNYAAARAHVGSLHSGGQLDESAVAAFATDNKFEETTAALATLCGLPIEVADRAMAQPRPEAVLVMAKAIDMSWPAAKAILWLQAAGRGISPGELDQSFATFSRLNTTTVRQIVAFQRKRRADDAIWPIGRLNCTNSALWARRARGEFASDALIWSSDIAPTSVSTLVKVSATDSKTVFACSDKTSIVADSCSSAWSKALS